MACQIAAWGAVINQRSAREDAGVYKAEPGTGF